MAGSPIRRARRERTEAFLAAEGTLDFICGEVASGRTLADVCRDPRRDDPETGEPEAKHDILFNAVNAWLQADEDRRKRYAAALETRDGHSKEEVIGALLRLVRVDITEAFTPEGNLRPIHEIPADVRSAIAGIEIEELFEGRGKSRENVGTLRKVKFWDKPRSIETLARHLKMLVERHEHTGKLTLADLLAEEPKR